MYYFVYSLLYVISLLPFWALYGMSDFCAFLLYRILKYRRNVVLGNLAIAFPEKSSAELEFIAKEFYKRFSDNFIELIKLLSLSEKQIQQRFVCDFNTLNSLYNEGLSVDIILGHSFNWEWANLAYAMQNPFIQLVVYAHVNNRTLERLMLKIRARFGTKLIDTYRFKEQFKPYATQQKAFILVADQSPRFVDNAFWLDFFGKKSAFAKGPDTNARLANNAVIFCHIKRLKRGFYTTELIVLTKAARELSRGDITKKTAAFIEHIIRHDPPNYLWSHRRWKHSYNETKHKKNLID
ncbi:MAG TPA: lipid A biosynthesis acyltransferase [Arachidicoccus soli]|nr:lipid A biosynthesis acyltransferase [Arachidicoccus soli]